MPAAAALTALAPPTPQPVRLLGRPAAIADHEAPLIRRAQAADPNAFGELYERHEPLVRRYVASRLFRREADVDDLVAETFLTAMQRIAAFEPDRPGAFGNWLIGIAKNKLADWLKCPMRRETALDDHYVEHVSGESASAEDVVLDRLEVAAALARLTPRARRALVLQHVAGLPTAEIALALGTTKRSIRALTGHARSQLRGEGRLCACGCGYALRLERWGRDRYASAACRQRPTVAPARVLCACGCGAPLPTVRAHNRRYATTSCRNRAAWRRRKEAQRRYLAGPVTADRAVDQVLAVVRAAGSPGTTRAELARQTRLLAARLDRALDLLAGRRSVSVGLEPGDGRLVMRYRALAGAAAGRAA